MFKLNIEQPETQSNRTKKAPEGAKFNNGGNDERICGRTTRI